MFSSALPPRFISDKCCGLLLRARRYKLLAFEGEMLFQVGQRVRLLFGKGDSCLRGSRPEKYINC